MFEAPLILLVIFGAITAWRLGPKYLELEHNRKLKELELGRRDDGPKVLQLEANRKELEERLRNLETIVCGVDLELNAKLNRLASRQIAALPPHAPTSQAIPPPSTADAALASTVAVPKLTAGTRLANRYVIERALGSGGMGAVYLAKDEQLGEPVALKILRDLYAHDPLVMDRFRRELSSARRISHPSVVRLHDLGQEGDTLFLTMEYVAGESLRALIDRQKSIPSAQLTTILQDVGDGLGAAHSAGVIHRDLKPENIIVYGNGRAKIIDFGIAKTADLEGMTATRMILGTPQYMSPEQIRGLPIDARSDLYSVATVAFEALTGSPPFTGGSPISVGFAHCHEPIPELRARRADVDPRWQPFVQRGLAKDPAQRFQTAVELRQAIPV
jgi:serine/threonine-protein kinase